MNAAACPRPAEVIAIVRVPLQRQVVAEPLRLLIRIGVTANPREQTRVVQRPAFAIVEPEPLRKTQRDQARTDHVLHRLPQPEIRPKRQQRDQLRETNLREPSRFHHDASLRTRRRRQHPSSTATDQRNTHVDSPDACRSAIRPELRAGAKPRPQSLATSPSTPHTEPAEVHRHDTSSPRPTQTTTTSLKQRCSEWTPMKRLLLLDARSPEW